MEFFDIRSGTRSVLRCSVSDGDGVRQLSCIKFRRNSFGVGVGSSSGSFSYYDVRHMQEYFSVGLGKTRDVSRVLSKGPFFCVEGALRAVLSRGRDLVLVDISKSGWIGVISPCRGTGLVCPRFKLNGSYYDVTITDFCFLNRQGYVLVASESPALSSCILYP